MLTFNPDWDAAAQNVDPFTDVRQLQAMLTAAGGSRSPGSDAASGYARWRPLPIPTPPWACGCWPWIW
jgi:hypothetical protein